MTQRTRVLQCHMYLQLGIVQVMVHWQYKWDLVSCSRASRRVSCRIASLAWRFSNITMNLKVLHSKICRGYKHAKHVYSTRARARRAIPWHLDNVRRKPSTVQRAKAADCFSLHAQVIKDVLPLRKGNQGLWHTFSVCWRNR